MKTPNTPRTYTPQERQQIARRAQHLMRTAPAELEGFARQVMQRAVDLPTVTPEQVAAGMLDRVTAAEPASTGTPKLHV